MSYLRTTPTSKAAQASIHAKIQQYNQFIEQTLTKDLQTATNLLEKIQQKHTDYPDPTRLFIDVGLGFHVELTLAEAVTWIDAKLPSLDKKISHVKEQAAMIQGKIKVVYEGIAELMQLQQQEKPQRQFF